MPTQMAGRGLIHLPLTMKIATIDKENYVENSEDTMLHLVSKHETKSFTQSNKADKGTSSRIPHITFTRG